MLSLHTLSVFLIPKGISDKINSIFARFLWAGSRETRPIFWKSMRTLRILTSNQTLISQVFRSKYKDSPVNIVMNKIKLGRVSWGFRGLCNSIQECTNGFNKRIGNGTQTHIQADKWLRGGPVELKQGFNMEELGVTKVHQLMNPS